MEGPLRRVRAPSTRCPALCLLLQRRAEPTSGQTTARTPSLSRSAPLWLRHGHDGGGHRPACARPRKHGIQGSSSRRWLPRVSITGTAAGPSPPARPRPAELLDQAQLGEAGARPPGWLLRTEGRLALFLRLPPKSLSFPARESPPGVGLPRRTLV